MMSMRPMPRTSARKGGWGRPRPPPPRPRVESEVVEHRDRREVERAIALAESDIDAGVAKAHDVGKPIVVDVEHEAGMTVDAPALVVTEVRHDRLRREGERAVAVAQCHVYAGVAEGHDIRKAVAAQVREHARMLVNAPAARLESEVCEHELRILEGAVAVAEGGPDTVVPEADDIREAAAREGTEETRVLFHPPAPGRVPVFALLDIADAPRAQEDGGVVGKDDRRRYPGV